MARLSESGFLWLMAALLLPYFAIAGFLNGWW